MADGVAERGAGVVGVGGRVDGVGDVEDGGVVEDVAEGGVGDDEVEGGVARADDGDGAARDGLAVPE